MLDLRVRARSCRSPWAVDPGRGMPHARAPDPASGAAFPRLRPRPYRQRTASRGRPRQGGAAAPVDGGMQDGRRAGRRRLLERLAGRQGAGGVVPVRGKPPPVLGPPKARTPHRTRVAAFPPCRPTPPAPSGALAPRHRRPSCRVSHRAGCACPSCAQCAHQCGPRRPCAASAGLPPRRARDAPAGGRTASLAPARHARRRLPAGEGAGQIHAACRSCRRRGGPNARSPAPAAG